MHHLNSSHNSLLLEEPKLEDLESFEKMRFYQILTNFSMNKAEKETKEARNSIRVCYHLIN